MAKTQVIASRCNNLEHEAELRAAVKLLVMEDRVGELSLANNLFNNLYLTRNTEYAAEPKGNMLSQRELVGSALPGILQHMHNLICRMVIQILINEINSLTDQYNQLLTNRSTG